MITCKGMRTAVLVSALLMGLGLLLQAIAEATPFAVPTSHLALFSMLASVFVLITTAAVSLAPGTAKRLADCQH